MTPLLIVKTKNGFAVIEFPGEMELPGNISEIDPDIVMVAENMNGPCRYSKDGLLGIVEEHFTEAPEAKE